MTYLCDDGVLVLPKLNFVVDPQRPRRPHDEANIAKTKVDHGGFRVQNLELVAVDHHGRPAIASDPAGGKLSYYVAAGGCRGCCLELLAGADGHGGGAGVRWRDAIVEEEERRKQR